jgi:hypothetical protein
VHTTRVGALTPADSIGLNGAICADPDTTETIAVGTDDAEAELSATDTFIACES